MRDLLPLFLTLAGRDVVLVGGGSVATSKLQALVDAGARVRVVAPSVTPEIERAAVEIARRAFVASDLDGAWLVVAAATPAVNREVAAAAESRVSANPRRGKHELPTPIGCRVGYFRSSAAGRVTRPRRSDRSR